MRREITLTENSPSRIARIAAVLFLLTILTGVFSEMFVSGRLIVSGDAAATATNILAHKELFRWGFTIYLIEMACNIAMTAFLYELLRPVSRSISLLAAIFSLVGCTIKTFSRLFYITPLLILGGAHPLSAFSREQLQELALLFLRVNDRGAAIGLVFFGFYALIKGSLLIRATFIPKILGILSMLGGVGWLTFLWPPLGYRLFPYLALIALAGSAALIFWLLVFGVNEQRWYEQADAAAARPVRRVAQA